MSRIIVSRSQKVLIRWEEQQTTWLILFSILIVSQWSNKWYGSHLITISGARQNDQLQQLTLVTIFFLPLTFLTVRTRRLVVCWPSLNGWQGYFGMNFAAFDGVQFHSDGYTRLHQELMSIFADRIQLLLDNCRACVFRDVVLSVVSRNLHSWSQMHYIDACPRRDMIKQYMVKRIQRRFISNSRKAREKKDAKSKTHWTEYVPWHIVCTLCIATDSVLAPQIFRDS